MTPENEKAIYEAIDFKDEEVNFDDLEKNLQAELEEKFEDLDFLEKEREHIKNPDHLGETVMNVVWEQFKNQVAVTAGEDFIKENNGLTLDLRDESHIQTAENFAEGTIATHNHISRDQLEQNYDRYKNMPHKEFRDKYVDPGMDATLKRAGDLKKQGIDTVTDIYTGRQIPTETKFENGKNNPKAAQREHVKPSAEIYQNPSLQMANSNEELATIINSPENLQGYTTADRNNRKSDNAPDQMSDVDKTKHWKKANEKADEYITKKEKEGTERLREEGHKTQKEEAVNATDKALRTALLALLGDLVKEIIVKLIHWFKSAEKNLQTFIDYVKMAIKSFVCKLKERFISTTDSVLTAIATAIVGPVVGTIKKTITLLKQGWKSLKEAVQYLRNPENKGKPLGELMPQVGIIVITGLTGIGALVLGEFIEKALMSVPFLAIEIPLLGSPANLIGTLMGAIVCGIIGAIAINLINRYIAKQQKNDNLNSQIDTKNEILKIHSKLTDVKIQKMVDTKEQTAQSIMERHQQANDRLSDALATIYREEDDDNADSLSSTADELAKLLS